MDDKDLNLRAGLAAFSDSDRVVAVNLDKFDALTSRDDLLHLLIETGISFHRASASEIVAEAGAGDSFRVEIEQGDVLAAAARAACSLAASWIDDDDVTAYRIATGRALR